MRIGKVIGTVTLSRWHPAFVGARWLVTLPYNLQGLRDNQATGESLIVYDQLGANVGSQIGFSEGVEAAVPFLPDRKPLDAYCACILDEITLRE